MQFAETGAHSGADAAAHVGEAVLDAVQSHGRIGAALLEAALAADVGLTMDGSRHTVETAGDGAMLIEQAGLVQTEQRTWELTVAQIMNSLLPN